MRLAVVATERRPSFCEACGTPIGPRRKYCAFCRPQASKEYRAELRTEFVKAYGGKCQCPGGCQVVEERFLTLEHVNGGGDQHRRRTKTSGYKMYQWLKDRGWPKEGYRLECFNCNLSRGYWGKCPHEEKASSNLKETE